MSQRKSERQLNLVLALLSTRRYLTKHELRNAIEGYRDTQVFDRAFERDKKELRELGIVIETGTEDPFSEEEDGYRINRRDFELPPLHFTASERAALGLASQVWQDSVAAEHTAQAIEALRAAGAEPDPSLIPTMRPQLAVEPDFDTVYAAVIDRRVLTFGYRDEPRRLQPWKLIQRRGRWYVFGYDTDRQADRFFKLSRFTSPAKASDKTGAYEIPDDVDERASRLQPEFAAEAIVGIRDGAWHPWREAEPAPGEAAPPGYTAHRIQAPSDEALIDDVVAAGPDLVLLGPARIRDRVIARLTEALA